MAPAFKPMYDAAKPAEGQISSHGGFTVGGQKYNVNILPEDDQSSPLGAVAAANRLIQQGVKFIIPPVWTPVCNITPCYDYLAKNYPKAKKIAMITWPAPLKSVQMLSYTLDPRTAPQKLVHP